MLPLATRIQQVVERELKRSDKPIDLDNTLIKVNFEICMGRRTGQPVKITCYKTYQTSETELIER